MLTVGTIQLIKDLHYRQRMSQRAIARLLKLDRKTVRRVLSGESDGAYTVSDVRVRPVGVPIAPVVLELLKEEREEGAPRKQRLTAKRVGKLVDERGHVASGATVRRVVAEARRELRDPLQLAMVPLVHEPSVDGQVDFCHGYVITPEGRQRQTYLLLWASFSTRLFVSRAASEEQESLFEALIRGCEHFGGVFHSLWFDNLSAAVQEVLKGSSRRLQRRFEQFQAHYGFEAKFCAPGAANEKGGVERAVTLFRRIALSPVPRIKEPGDIDGVIDAWMLRDLERRPAKRHATVAELWSLEDDLIPLPARRFDTAQVCFRRVSAYSLVQVGTNFYSVPTVYVSQKVTVKTFSERVEIHARDGRIAKHDRLRGRGQVAFCLEHYLDLLERKARAFDQAAPVLAVRKEWPRAYELLLRVMRDREGEAEGTRAFIQVLCLHDHHPAERVLAAVHQALTHEHPSVSTVLYFVDGARRRAEPIETLAHEDTVHLPEIKIVPGPLDEYGKILRGKTP